MATIRERIRDVFSIFKGREPTQNELPYGYFSGGSIIPSRRRLNWENERSIVTSIYGQIAVDCSSIDINHVLLDEDKRFKEYMDDSLNQLLTVSANIDQTGRAFIRDVVLSMLDEGVVALVPTVTTVNPKNTDSFRVIEARTAKIVQWFPKHVRVEVYNDRNGQHEQIVVEKRYTPIIENPFYTIMNEPNSTYKRLLRIYNQVDRTNEDNASGKLNMLIQFPYVIRSDARKKQAQARRNDIVEQLSGNKYGIAYTDATEKIVQLNRSIENNLWEQAKDLKQDLFNQLGFSQAIFDGTADEKVMLNYNNRTIEPILSAIVEEIARKWLSKTARTQGQSIRFFRDPFKLVPVNQLAENADKLTRNEIMTSNEIRTAIGMKPSDDPKADMLVNSNLNQSTEQIKEQQTGSGFQNE